jgi:hypothetical protein
MESKDERKLLLKGKKLNFRAFQSAKREPWSFLKAEEV